MLLLAIEYEIEWLVLLLCSSGRVDDLTRLTFLLLKFVSVFKSLKDDDEELFFAVLLLNLNVSLLLFCLDFNLIGCCALKKNKLIFFN